MKKVSFAFSIVLMASLLLAACGGGNNVTEGTPGALGTSDTGTIPNTGTTATLMATEPAAVSTATEAAPMATSTTAGSTLATETPVAGAQSTTGAPVVDLAKQPDRLSALLAYEVRNEAGDVIGEVNGLLVNRSKVVSEDVTDNSTTTQATGTPAAGAAATGTPASGTDTGTGTTMTNGQSGAQITYVVVELNDTFNSGATGTDTGSTTTQTTTTPAAGATAMPSTTQTVSGLAGDNAGTGTAMAGDEVLMPLAAFQPLMVGSSSTANDTEDPALVLTVDETALASAPVFDRDNLDFTTSTWDADFQAFWTGQGLSIPVTGGETMTNAETVLFEDGFGDIEATNTNEEDLGEVEDFIINPTTGEFNYAILAAGGFLGLGEKHIPVPMSMVNWVVDDDTVEDRDLNDLGKVLINVPEDAFKNAPSFDALDQLDTTVTDWDTDITSYWQTFDTGSSK